MLQQDLWKTINDQTSIHVLNISIWLAQQRIYYQLVPFIFTTVLPRTFHMSEYTKYVITCLQLKQIIRQIEKRLIVTMTTVLIIINSKLPITIFHLLTQGQCVLLDSGCDFIWMKQTSSVSPVCMHFQGIARKHWPDYHEYITWTVELWNRWVMLSCFARQWDRTDHNRHHIHMW